MTVFPFSGLSYLLDGLLPLIAWVIIMRRRRQTPDNHQLDIWAGFFLCMGLFLVIMALPHVLVYSQPDLFPEAMNIGYIVGHIFLYVSLASLVRLNSSLTERLYGRERQLYWLWIAIGAVITIINTILPNKPELTSQGITNLGASAPIGALIPLFTMATLLPLAILFLRSAARSGQPSDTRKRSILLGVGLILLMIAGPMHDFAQIPNVLFVADTFTVAAQLLLLLGVLLKPRPQPS